MMSGVKPTKKVADTNRASLGNDAGERQ